MAVAPLSPASETMLSRAREYCPDFGQSRVLAAVAACVPEAVWPALIDPHLPTSAAYPDAFAAVAGARERVCDTLLAGNVRVRPIGKSAPLLRILFGWEAGEPDAPPAGYVFAGDLAAKIARLRLPEGPAAEKTADTLRRLFRTRGPDRLARMMCVCRLFDADVGGVPMGSVLELIGEFAMEGDGAGHRDKRALDRIKDVFDCLAQGVDLGFLRDVSLASGRGLAVLGATSHDLAIKRAAGSNADGDTLEEIFAALDDDLGGDDLYASATALASDHAAFKEWRYASMRDGVLTEDQLAAWVRERVPVFGPKGEIAAPGDAWWLTDNGRDYYVVLTDNPLRLWNAGHRPRFGASSCLDWDGGSYRECLLSLVTDPWRRTLFVLDQDGATVARTCLWLLEDRAKQEVVLRATCTYGRADLHWATSLAAAATAREMGVDLAWMPENHGPRLHFLRGRPCAIQNDDVGGDPGAQGSMTYRVVPVASAPTDGELSRGMFDRAAARLGSAAPSWLTLIFGQAAGGPGVFDIGPLHDVAGAELPRHDTEVCHMVARLATDGKMSVDMARELVLADGAGEFPAWRQARGRAPLFRKALGEERWRLWTSSSPEEDADLWHETRAKELLALGRNTGGRPTSLRWDGGANADLLVDIVCDATHRVLRSCGNAGGAGAGGRGVLSLVQDGEDQPAVYLRGLFPSTDEFRPQTKRIARAAAALCERMNLPLVVAPAMAERAGMLEPVNDGAHILVRPPDCPTAVAWNRFMDCGEAPSPCGWSLPLLRLPPQCPGPDMAPLHEPAAAPVAAM